MDNAGQSGLDDLGHYMQACSRLRKELTEARDVLMAAYQCISILVADLRWDAYMAHQNATQMQIDIARIWPFAWAGSAHDPVPKSLDRGN